MESSKSCSKKEVYSNIILPQDLRKISNKQPKLTPKAIRKNKQSPKLVGKKSQRSEQK